VAGGALAVGALVGAALGMEATGGAREGKVAGVAREAEVAEGMRAMTPFFSIAIFFGIGHDWESYPPI
jgi:hypothetical protein